MVQRNLVYLLFIQSFIYSSSQIASKPESGQTLRLAGGNKVNAGFLEKLRNPENQWNTICLDSHWNETAANVACRELGYDLGFEGFQARDVAEYSNNGFNLQALNLKCKGNEKSLDECEKQKENSTCERSRQALFLGCKKHPVSSCPSEYTRFKDKCFRIYNQSKAFVEAQSQCQSHVNGQLVEIKSQLENDFLSDYIIKKYPNYQGESFWTGGVTTKVANLQLNIWHSSQETINFKKFYKQIPSLQSEGIALYLQDGYYYWKYQDLFMALPFICEAPLQNIGCLKDPLDKNNKYEGNASRVDSGENCLPWNTPEIRGFLTTSQRNWNHNYCRKIEKDEGPSCYYYDETEGIYKYDICTIPLCSSPALNSDVYNLCSEAFPEKFPERLGKLNLSTNRCPKSSERSDLYQLCSDSFPRKFHSEVIKEVRQSCEENEFMCKNRKCIDIHDLCDGVDQCGDSSDENSIECSRPTKIRLRDGPNSKIGRVEIYHKSVWGTICSENFGTKEAQVVCRMAGFSSDNAKVYKLTTNFKGSGPIWIRFDEENACNGNETNITECTEEHLWEHYTGHCKHVEDVAVSCEDDLFQNILDSTSDVDNRNDVIDIQANEAVQSFENLDTECGILKPKPQIIPKIQGGVDATCGEHPWQASIRVKGQKQNYHWCGATIISRFHLITAAHCLKDFSKSSYLVRVGDCHLDIKEIEEDDYDIDEITFHENFNEGPYLNNDIALVSIRGELTFGDHVSSACLPPSNLAYPTNLNLTITGWGKANYDSNSNANLPRQNKEGAVIRLQKADVPILLTSLCTSQKIYGKEKVSEGMFCAGDLEGQKDACKGDSGGPAIAKIQGRATLLGITSWGYGCGRKNKPGVYTKVREYVKWIEKHTN